jgi:hypothetical protein
MLEEDGLLDGFGLRTGLNTLKGTADDLAEDFTCDFEGNFEVQCWVGDSFFVKNPFTFC